MSSSVPMNTSSSQKRRTRSISFPTATEVKISEEYEADRECLLAEIANKKAKKSDRKNQIRETNRQLVRDIEKLGEMFLFFYIRLSFLKRNFEEVHSFLNAIVFLLGKRTHVPMGHFPSHTLNVLSSFESQAVLQSFTRIFTEFKRMFIQHNNNTDRWANVSVMCHINEDDEDVGNRLEISFHWWQLDLRICTSHTHEKKDRYRSYGVFARFDIPLGTRFKYFGFVTDHFISERCVSSNAISALMSAHGSSSSPSPERCSYLPDGINLVVFIHSPVHPPLLPSCGFDDSSLDCPYFVTTRDLKRGEELTSFIPPRWQRAFHHTRSLIKTARHEDDDDGETFFEIPPQ